MKLAVFAFSRRGRDTARRCLAALAGPGDEYRAYASESWAGEGFSPIRPPLADFTAPVFAWADAMVFVGACGIAVRAIAPHVRDKRTDPAVLAVDELGQFVIPLLSGHIGGANRLAARLAEAVGATAVVTTATDVNRRFSVDEWSARQGLYIDDMAAAKAVSAAILEGPVPVWSDFPIAGDLPAGLEPGESGPLGICISWRRKFPFDRTLLLVPPVLRLGIGCRRGTSSGAIAALADQLLAEHNVHPAAVGSRGHHRLKKRRDRTAGFLPGPGLAPVLLQRGGAGGGGGGLHPLGFRPLRHRGGQRVRAGRPAGGGAPAGQKNRPGRRHRRPGAERLGGALWVS